MSGFHRQDGQLNFIPLSSVDKTFLFQDRTVELDDISSRIITKIRSVIEDCGSADDLGDFVETDDDEILCIQGWLVDFLNEEELDAQLIEKIAKSPKEIKKLTEQYETYLNEGPCRPTRHPSFDKNPAVYELAERLESTMNGYELVAVLAVASLAKEYNLDIERIYDSWDENGWEEEIQALKNHLLPD